MRFKPARKSFIFVLQGVCPATTAKRVVRTTPPTVEENKRVISEHTADCETVKQKKSNVIVKDEKHPKREGGALE